MMKEYGNTVRVNKDSLREMLHTGVWTGKNESLTREVEFAIASRCIENDVNVIVDDTNMGQSHLDSWKAVAKRFDAKFEHIHVDTRWEECLRRDDERGMEGAVGHHVIKGMAMQYDLYKPEKSLVCVDMDGTLADVTHRLHFVQGDQKDWKGFFFNMHGDSLRQDVYETVKQKSYDHTIIIVSARPENYRAVTEAWLNYHEVPYFTVLMRRESDKRDDTEVKKGIYETYLKHYPIDTVIDDRPKVIRMWRELGLNVIDVGNGVEF